MVERHPQDGWCLADPAPLSRASERALRSVVHALLPPPPAPRPADIEARVTRQVRCMMQYMPTPLRLGFVLLIRALAWAPIWRFHALSSLAKLPQHEASRVLAGIAMSRVMPLRLMMLAPKAIVLSVVLRPGRSACGARLRAARLHPRAQPPPRGDLGGRARTRVSRRRHAAPQEDASRGVVMMLRYEDYEQERSFDADVVVVGTGAGGSVVGALLAEAGYSVLFVEEGAHHKTESFNPYVTESVPRLYRDASATVIMGAPADSLHRGTLRGWQHHHQRRHDLARTRASAQALGGEEWPERALIECAGADVRAGGSRTSRSSRSRPNRSARTAASCARAPRSSAGRTCTTIAINTAAWARTTACSAVPRAPSNRLW